MRQIDSFTHEVIEESNVWIPMPDGMRLAARIWRPSDGSPVPAILEYIPYRQRFGTTDRDAITHPYFAGHGYASVRVDLRGSGESDGLLTGEYLQAELDDGLEVIRWIASQPWCDGNVGMMGISWGGFNALQIAALGPPALKAIVTVCSTDDRYADDIHFMGGCVLCDKLSWASVMFSLNSMPPDPGLVGDRWRDMWMERLEGSGLWLEPWLEHQHRDVFWRHGSVCEDYGAIRCPVYAVGGWADGYTNAVFRLLANLQVPRKALIGPWSHTYPHLGRPGPAIGFLQEVLRWWDLWLKGMDTGIMAEPMLRVWMQDSVAPHTSYTHRPGRWVAEETWPTPRIQDQRLHMRSEGKLSSSSDGFMGSVSLSSPLWVGRAAGKWCSYLDGPDLPGDQRHDDAGSLVFETDPLSKPIEMLGAPVVELEVASDQTVAQLAVRLSDVDEYGRATRVSYGLFNLTHRYSHHDPEPLQPGRSYPIRIRLNEAAQVFPVGHRIRLSLSTSYWPLAWPVPAPTRITVYLRDSGLVLPIRHPRPRDDHLRTFPEPEGASPADRTFLDPPDSSWRHHHDLGEDMWELEVVNDEGRINHNDIELVTSTRAVERYAIRVGDPTSARGEVSTERTMERGEWSVRTVTNTVLACTAHSFVIEAHLEASEGGEPLFHRTWRTEIPRKLV